MHGYGPASYGEGFADVYDDWYPSDADTDRVVRALVELAGGGTVLELGCGTGRLCLPLARARLSVHGLDASATMLERLAAKIPAGGVGPGRIETHLGDMAGFELGTAFDLVFAAFNTFFNLPTESSQAACLGCIRRHLAPGGTLALECFVPGDPPEERLDAVELRTLAADRVVLRVSRQDAAAQTVSGQHIELSEAGVRLRPWHLHYLTPAQLDALAEQAGLGLVRRAADWSGRPFDASSTSHVSLYRRAAGEGPGGDSNRADPNRGDPNRGER